MPGAFDLLDRPLVYVPIKWPGVGQSDDGAAVAVEHMVEVQVELLDRDEFADWIVDANRDIEDKADRSAHELATFKRVAKGWRKVRMSNRAAPFDDGNIATLLRFPGFVTAFGTTYMDTWRGEVAIREGNSEGSPATGPEGGPTDATPKEPKSAN